MVQALNDKHKFLQNQLSKISERAQGKTSVKTIEDELSTDEDNSYVDQTVTKRKEEYVLVTIWMLWKKIFKTLRMVDHN